MSKKTEEAKTVELYPYTHLKQGDAWDSFLEDAKGDVVVALHAWADDMAERARELKAVASRLEVLKDKRGLRGYGMTHVACISGLTPETLKLVLEVDDAAAEQKYERDEDEG